MGQAAVKNFKCPKCGGGSFGAIIKTITPFVISHYECHNLKNGQLVTWIADAASMAMRNRELREIGLCNWRGSAAECLTD